MWKVAVVALFKELVWHMPGGTEESRLKPRLGQSGVPIEIRIGHLLNTSQKHYYLSQLARYGFNIHHSSVLSLV
jgi:hypothetical protein